MLCMEFFNSEKGTSFQKKMNSLMHVLQLQALIPNFWCQLWIINKLVRVDQIYSFPSFYSILSDTLSYIY